jgi:hypothetical protein
LGNADITDLIKSFPSQAVAMNNVSTIASFAQAKGYSFSPPQKRPGSKSLSPRENAQRHARQAVKESYSKTLPAFQQLPTFGTEFTKIPGNGVATCSVDNATGIFKDFFLVFDASIEIAMHASMRVVAMDGAHMPNLRKDLRLLVLEGVTSDNTIYTIAFMLCWGETIATVGRFFDLLKYHRPHFYDGWFDNEATTLIADRGPGRFFKSVVFQKLANGESMLRSCVLHVVRGATLQFPAWMKKNHKLIWSLGTSFEIAETSSLLKELRESNQDVYDYVRNSDYQFWMPAYIPPAKAHFYKVTSNNVEQEFSRFNHYNIRSKDPIAMCLAICALVEKCHTTFKETCRRQKHHGLLLTPFATTLHEREKAAVLDENLTVSPLNPTNPNQKCNVFMRGQQMQRRVVAHTSYNTCSCDFHLAMMIPCKHQEAWRVKATNTQSMLGATPAIAYKAWVANRIMKQYQIEYILQKVDHVTILAPCMGTWTIDDTLSLPPIARQTKPTNSNDTRMKAHNEPGYQRQRKRTLPATAHELTVDQIVRHAQPGTYMMVKYKGMLSQTTLIILIIFGCD